MKKLRRENNGEREKKKYRKERKRGKEAGERGEVINFVLESKSCIG